MTIRNLTDYAGNLKGVALYALDMWEYWKDSPGEDYNLGQRHAYAAILRLITGRSVASEESTVREVIAGMSSNRG